MPKTPKIKQHQAKRSNKIVVHWVPPPTRLRRSRPRRLVSYRGVCFLAAAALIFTATAQAAGSFYQLPGDPRKCSTGTARTCARNMAGLVLEKALGDRLGVGFWQGERITCRGAVGWLRWVCTFKSPAEHGWALVLLGSPPNWHATVVVKRLVCTRKPTRQGCP